MNPLQWLQEVDALQSHGDGAWLPDRRSVPQFGQLYCNPEFYIVHQFRQFRVETWAPRLAQLAGELLQPVQGDRTGQQREADLIQLIEQIAAALDGATPILSCIRHFLYRQKRLNRRQGRGRRHRGCGRFTGIELRSKIFSALVGGAVAAPQRGRSDRCRTGNFHAVLEEPGRDQERSNIAQADLITGKHRQILPPAGNSCRQFQLAAIRRAQISAVFGPPNWHGIR